MKRRLAAALLGLALTLAGCTGTDDDGDGVASAGGDATEEPSPGELSEDEIYEAQLAYAQCMREHGIDMEDPQPGEGLRLRVEGDPEEAEAAQEACQDLLPDRGPGNGGGEQPDQERMLAFAQCMRDNGVESFEDPEPGGGIQIGPAQAEDPDFDAAQETCNEEFMGGQPETETNGGGGA